MCWLCARAFMPWIDSSEIFVVPHRINQTVPSGLEPSRVKARIEIAYDERVRVLSVIPAGPSGVETYSHCIGFRPFLTGGSREHDCGSLFARTTAILISV